MNDPRTDPTAGLRHWVVEVNFEAWDEADAKRMVSRMLRPLDEEQRLLYATSPPKETFEMRSDV